MRTVRRMISIIGAASLIAVGLAALGPGWSAPALANSPGDYDLVVDDDGQAMTEGCDVEQTSRSRRGLISTYTSIQAAVNDASEGDRVLVCPGEYVENIVIDKQLTLHGSGSGGSADASSDTIIVSDAASTPVIEIAAGGASEDVRLEIGHLRVTGAFGPDSGNAETGIAVLAGPGHLMFDDVDSVDNDGNGIAINSVDAFEDIVLSDCELLGNGNSGLRLPTSTAGVDGLTITGCQMNGNRAGFTMFGSLANATTEDSTFNGNLGVPDEFTGGYGIIFNLFQRDQQTVENVFFDNIEASGNGDSGISSGLQLAPYDGDSITGVQIENSSFLNNDTMSSSGFSRGLSLETRTNSVLEVEVAHSEFSGSDIGVVLGWGSGSADVEIHQSNIAGNTDAGVANFFTDGTTIVDAENNWWGADDGPSGVGPGSGDAVTEQVDFDPWLTEPAEGDDDGEDDGDGRRSRRR